MKYKTLKLLLQKKRTWYNIILDFASILLLPENMAVTTAMSFA